MSGQEAQTTTQATTSTDVVAEQKNQTAQQQEAKQNVAPPVAARDDKDVELGDDDDLPSDGKQYVRMSLGALQKRLKSASRSELRRVFGTDSITEIVAMKKELDDRRSKEEEDRKASMAEIDRIKEEAAKEKSAREAAEARAVALEEGQLRKEADETLKEIAVENIKPKFWKHAAAELREHLSDNFEDPDKVRVDDVRKFFADYIKEYPEHAHVADTPPPPPKAGLTNGPAATKPAPATNAASQGNAKDWSEKQWREEKVKRGWNF